MKQVLQDLKSGETVLAEVPAPVAQPGAVLIGTTRSLISAGTERMLVEFGKANLLSKVRQQPDRVADVLAKMKTDGVLATLEAVDAKLSTPLTLGYCNVGCVLEQADGFAAGDRVVSNGSHAEIVSVPANLACKIPDDVTDEQASFCVIGAIAMQGVRLAEPTIAERFVVMGMGMIGLLALQILRANGCRVLALDTNAERLELARQFGAETLNISGAADPVARAMAFSGNDGVDGVLIAASTTSNDPVSSAAKMCRKRGRVVLLGVVGLQLKREDFYEKEISFQVSCSYGPGRYDPDYEDKGHDYPIGFVRWTEGRNFAAVLDLMADGKIDTAPLATHRFAIEDAGEAYRTLTDDPAALGIVLEYPAPQGEPERLVPIAQASPSASGKADEAPSVSFIGAGNYAGRVLVKAFSDAGARLRTVTSSGGVSARHVAKKYGFSHASSDAAATIAADETDIVVIATRHDTHARFALDALAAGRHVFVEKPLCLTLDELEEIADAARRGGAGRLMVGFNRRFAPLITKMADALGQTSEPRTINIRVSAGKIPVDHWTQDPATGGGRIVGEACHFIDLARFLTASPIVDMAVDALDQPDGPPLADNVVVTLRHRNGSLSTIQYLANGPKAVAKERIEVFVGGRALLLDNFRKLEAPGFERGTASRSLRLDKGQGECVAQFVAAVKKGSETPIPLDEILEVSRLSIEAARRTA